MGCYDDMVSVFRGSVMIECVIIKYKMVLV